MYPKIHTKFRLHAFWKIGILDFRRSHKMLTALNITHLQAGLFAFALALSPMICAGLMLRGGR